MPLVLPPSIGHGGSLETNLTAASRAGTTVTASATPHTKGSWSSLIDPTSRPSYGVWVVVATVATTGTNTSLLVDIGYGPTGGGNEQVVLPDLDAGYVGLTSVVRGRCYYFPVYIPTGVRVSARCQAVIASDTVVVGIYLEQDSLYPPAGGGVLAYGADTANSRGTSVTPASGAFGSWAQLTASTTRAHRFWAAGYDPLGDTSIATAGEVLVELGVGPDSSNVSRIYAGTTAQTTAEALGPMFPLLCYGPVPAARAIWARLASNETEPRGVIAYGVD